MTLFCPKCGSILIPKEDGRKKRLTCSCGYSSKEDEDILLQENFRKDRKIEVLDQNVEVLPRTEEECPKCKNKFAYFWTVQTRAGDEAETRFFECVKCKHRWRDYS